MNGLYVKLRNRGLSFIDPEAATKNLLVKWVIKTFDDDKSHICLLIQFGPRIAHPYVKNKWSHGVGWMFQNHHLPTHGSYVWNKIRKAWKNILEHVSILPPQDMYQVMTCTFGGTWIFKGLDLDSQEIEQHNYIGMDIVKLKPMRF